MESDLLVGPGLRAIAWTASFAGSAENRLVRYSVDGNPIWTYRPGANARVWPIASDEDRGVVVGLVDRAPASSRGAAALGTTELVALRGKDGQPVGRLQLQPTDRGASASDDGHTLLIIGDRPRLVGSNLQFIKFLDYLRPPSGRTVDWDQLLAIAPDGAWTMFTGASGPRGSDRIYAVGTQQWELRTFGSVLATYRTRPVFSEGGRYALLAGQHDETAAVVHTLNTEDPTEPAREDAIVPGAQETLALLQLRARAGQIETRLPKVLWVQTRGHASKAMSAMSESAIPPLFGVAVAELPDGVAIAASYKGRVEVCRIDTSGTLVQRGEMSLPNDFAARVAIASGTATVTAVGANGKGVLRVWDLDLSGRQLSHLEAPGRSVRALYVSPDGHHALVQGTASLHFLHRDDAK
jgi:hypothetical protein